MAAQLVAGALLSAAAWAGGALLSSAAEWVGGALLSVVIWVAGPLLSALQVLFDRLAPRMIPKFLRGKEPITDLLGELRTVVERAKRLVNDAEEKQITNDDVREWLAELNDMVYRTEDLVDTIESEAQRQELEGDGSSGSAGYDETVVKNEATEILAKVKSLLVQKDNLGLREGVEKITPSTRPLIPLAEESSVCGRERDKAAIVELMLFGNGTGDKISVIPITGMGGIGKTTLAQLVYNDAKVKKHFAVRAWVTVSDDFDIYKIMKVIFEQVKSKSEKCRTQELFELQNKLSDALRGNLFLLVLDDVWNENYNQWDILKSSFESGAEGSKIVVTTRSTGVASVGNTTNYPLTFLSTDDSWQLFAKHAFGSNADPDAHQDLQEIGREIVNKCKGLPLAIKSLGGLLRSERNLKKWENILKSDVWDDFYRKKSDILPALWLSYRHMPMHLKRCFSYCSIFPKDYEFQKERIILLWMAEGFLQSNQQSVTMEELGEEYFEDLLSRSLFQKSTSEGESIFVMHDLVHDLAMFVSGRFCFRLDESNELRSLGSQTRHLSGSFKSTKFEGIGNAKCLRTFIQLRLDWNPYSAHSCLEVLLTSGRFLRVLCLGSSSIKELSSSIGNLIHLRYLDVSYSGIKELPGSVCSLHNLQTLLLSWCSDLKELPKNMEKLVNLRHLDIAGVPLKEMGFQIKKMKSLQTSSKIVVGGGDELSPNKINELKEVQPFQGRLEICRIENVGDANEALEANLKDKKGLLDLTLTWSLDSFGDAISSKTEREILDALEPHTTITYLRIECYRGTIFSEWVGHDSFSNVVSIQLSKCKSCVFLPPLGQLLSLKQLHISGFESVERVGDEFYGNSSSSFGCLETLEISDMEQWKEWSLFGGEGRVVFPRLSSLILMSCPKLNISWRPNTDHPRTAFPSLVSLQVLDCGSPVHELLPGLVPLSKLECLYLSDWEGESFPPDGFLAASLVQISLFNCKKLVALNGKAFQQLTSLEKLFIDNCPELRCLPEEGLPASLSKLRIRKCPLLKQRCDKGEDWPKIFHIAHVELF